jgi:hypothetical protein
MKAIKSPIERGEKQRRRAARKEAARKETARKEAARQQAAAQQRSSTTKKKKAESPSALARLGAWWTSWRRSTRAAAARAEPSSTPPATTTRPASRSGTAPRGGRIAFAFHPLEVAQAHDGALRGLADPTLLFAVFGIDDHRRQLQPVLRSVVRYRLPSAAPCAAPPDVASVVSTSLRSCARALVVATLWEENSGVDVRALAAALERPDDLHLVDLAHVTPEVHTALDAVGPPPPAPPLLAALVPRGILVDHADVARARSDTWVGGAVVVIATNHWRSAEHRIALRSADRRQDWTLAFATHRV